MKIALITGSAGFIGTNLTEYLLENDYKVIGIDNFCASDKSKVDLFKDYKNYEFIEADITDNLNKIIHHKSEFLKEHKQIDYIFNLACPASPPRYLKIPIETIKVNVDGVMNVLDLAKMYGSKVLHTSTSEVYGDPEVHPQVENYRGNVNTVGPRSAYDEGKRISETICYEYNKLYKIPVKIVRIFNTFGPYMDPDDGRVITNFIKQALNGEDLTVYEKGEQTRSFQYIDDLIIGFMKFLETEDNFIGPMNLGNPKEFTMVELANMVIEKIGGKSKIQFIVQDSSNPYNKAHDPQRRKPDISLAREKFGYDPQIQLSEGLDKTIEYYKKLLGK